MSLFLTAVGILLLVPSLAGIVFGAYMATHPKTRDSGVLFALLWLPAAAGVVGILLRDPVTVIVGLICFLVAGAAVLLSGGKSGKKATEDRRISSEERRNTSSTRTTQENQKEKRYRKAAS